MHWINKSELEKVNLVEDFNDLMEVKLNITGEDLKNLGIKPSSLYNECFNHILKIKLSNKAITYNEELALAGKFFKEYV